jgi:hypothetical protein
MPEWISKITKPELKGLAESRKWENPEMLLESFHNLEKLRGIPQDRIMAVPDSTDQAALDQVYNRLGRPDKPELYGLPKDAEGSDTNKWMAETMHKLGLSAQQAKALFEANKARTDGLQQKATERINGEVANQLAALKTEWGAAFEANEQLAASTLARFGLDAKAIAPLKESVGGVNLMKFLVAVGKGMGEGSFIEGGGIRNPNAPMTPAEAKNTIKERMKDRGFTERLVAKDAATVAEWERLNKWAAPQPAV